MANFNRVLLIGNMTRDPDLSYLPSQTPVVEFGLAVNRRWTGKDGSQREDTCFIDCRAFAKPAEIINKYMSKGQPIFIEGRLDFDTWEAQDGSRRSKHRVTVQNFQFLGGGKQSDNTSEQTANSSGSNKNQAPPSGSDDDIPF